MNTTKFDLFDKVINITLIDGSGKATPITCPTTGMKPDITISGKFAAEISTMSEISIKNLYLPLPLNADELGSSYKWVRIEAGYRNSLYTTFEGEVYTASQDKPGPDSVTRIQFMSGPFTNLMTKQVSKDHYAKDTSLNAVLEDVCLQVANSYVRPRLVSFISDQVTLPCDLHTQCTLFEFLTSLKKQFNISISVEGNSIRVFSAAVASDWQTQVTELTNITSLKKTAAGVYVIAPWVPELRMDSVIKVTSKYFAVENYGATSVVLGTDFRVVSIAYNFSTCGTSNSMTLMATGKENKIA